jgi:hypothetical protein
LGSDGQTVADQDVDDGFYGAMKARLHGSSPPVF